MSETEHSESYSTPPGSCAVSEVEELRKEVETLRRELEYLRVIVLKDVRQTEVAKKPFKVPIEIKLPSFRDENQDSPIDFMRNFDQYCTIKDVPGEYIPIILESAMKERAGLWFQMIKNEIDDVDQFRNAFAEEFFSVEVKTRAKDAWRSRKYRSTEGPMLSFFYSQTSEINNIDPTFNEYERNYVILKQLPTDVQLGLSGTDLKDTKKLTYAISRMDDARRQSPTRVSQNGERSVNKGNERFTWGNANYRGAGNERNHTSYGKEWGISSGVEKRNGQYDHRENQRYENEARLRDNFRKSPWQEMNRENRPINTTYRNRVNPDNTRNTNNDANRSSWRDQGPGKTGGPEQSTNRRAAPLNLLRENDNRDDRTPNVEDENAITVQAEIHHLNS